MLKQDQILIVDFGSQYTWLIARRLRELGFLAEVTSIQKASKLISETYIKGVILSGGPSSVYDLGSPRLETTEFPQDKPLLGICYGMQLMTHILGGKVEPSSVREYGESRIQWLQANPLYPEPSQRVWMSHGDVVREVPPGFSVLARSENGLIAAMGKGHWFGLQFHPEVTHTLHGDRILEHFARICGLAPQWTSHTILEIILADLPKQKGPGRILCALSGGVDSTVTALLLQRAFGSSELECVFVDSGLLRKDEALEVMKAYASLGLKVRKVDAKEKFLQVLRGVTDPEQKRKKIGICFIEVFESLLPELTDVKYLAQGTLYPDVIESTHPHQDQVSKTIKSHHNVGGLPERMKLKVIEPLRFLFKDEVRRIGELLGVPPDLLNRHPFPGPGLAIRILGEVTAEDLRLLQEADALFIQALKDHQLYDRIWQAFCVLLPVKTVGVQGDGRTYDRVLALRAVTSQDGMTADWFDFPNSFLREVSRSITNKIKGINRVVYDISSKPPATIEWE